MQLKLIDKREEAKDTMSFWFEAEKNISWIPGQYFYFTIPSPKYPDTRGNTHHFTIATSPTEGNTIMAATRMRDKSNYKKSLGHLKKGDTIEGEGPEGTFVLDEKEKGPHILIAGGIGITPFRSMIKYSIDKGLSDKLHLLYANSTPREITFKDELETWAKENEHVSVDFTVSKPNKSWKGLSGRIDKEMIKKSVGNCGLKIKNCFFWVCGPPVFIAAMEKELGKLKITSDKIRSEKFSGYSN